MQVDVALAKALEAATAAQRWDVVAQLARQLEALQSSPASNVVDLPLRRAVVRESTER